MRKTAFFIISLAASALAFPGAAEAATSSVKCSGGGTVTASTGTQTGTCVAGTTDGKVICKDGGKVVSQGACSGGKPYCGNSTGAGTCNLARKLVSTKPKRPLATTHR